MKINPENVKGDEILYFVYKKRRIAKIRAYCYDEYNDEIFINFGQNGIPIKGLNFYTTQLEAARELRVYHFEEYWRYREMATALRDKENE
jgi:hypothetical protein